MASLLQVLPTPTTASNPNPYFHINAERLRGKERSAEQLRGKIVIALFGGSMTFDGQQSDGQSWPDRLQDILGSRYEVINHGMGGYTTAEHVIQTAFYERSHGVSPTCSVYYVGWNDLRNAHIRNLDPAYADFHLPSQVDSMRVRRTDTSTSISPLVALGGRLLGNTFDTIRPAAPQGTISSAPDPAFEEIFLRNVAAISAINRQRRIRTIWVGQLMNRELLANDNSPPGWIPFVPSGEVFALIQRLSGLLKREAEALGDVYVALPVEEFDKGGFRDQGHFTPKGSQTFATLLAPAIRQTCP